VNSIIEGKVERRRTVDSGKRFSKTAENVQNACKVVKVIYYM
jgi:hypothetical protein